MKRWQFLAVVVVGGLLVPGVASAHGGTYRGPGDTVPEGLGGGGGGGNPAAGPFWPSSGDPGQPGTGGITGPRVPGGNTSGPNSREGSSASGLDLTQWTFWWEFNKEPYLNLKAHIWSPGAKTGSEGFFLGHGQRDQARNNLRPSEGEIRGEIVPALLAALKSETSNHVVTGALIALAKIGDTKDESGRSAFEEVIRPFLADANQEISETAAVALGILANRASIPVLGELLADSPAGRELVGGRHEVPHRTRAFAAYALGLVGARGATEPYRRTIVGLLQRTFAADASRNRDLRVACIIAMGLVPLEPTGMGFAADEPEDIDPTGGRELQIEALLQVLRDDQRNHLVRAHCPTSLARLLRGLGPEHAAPLRESVARALLERIAPRSKEKNEVVQSAVLALGMIGSNDGRADLDRDIRAGIERAFSEHRDQQTQRFALIAMARAGANPGAVDVETGIGAAQSFLLGHLARKTDLRSWAALGLGVLGHELPQAEFGRVATMSAAVRGTLEAEQNALRVGALAIGLGLLRDQDASDLLLHRLRSERDDSARGYVALALGLMDEVRAEDEIRDVVAASKYRPELLRQAAIALGLLGDVDLVGQLTAMLSESRTLASQAAIASALGFIGDKRSIRPLVAMLSDAELSGQARGLAAAALGIVADKEPLPWNAAIGVDLNYRASTSTLTSPGVATGILDLL